MQGKGIRQTGFVPSVYGLALVYGERFNNLSQEGLLTVKTFRPSNKRWCCGTFSFFWPMHRRVPIHFGKVGRIGKKARGAFNLSSIVSFNTLGYFSSHALLCGLETCFNSTWVFSQERA